MSNIIEKFYSPETLEEVVKLKNEFKRNAVIVGGSTAIGKNKGLLKPVMIDIKKAGVSFIKKTENGFKIGAAIRIAELMENKDINSSYNNIFYAVCKNLATAPLRNMITVGGNSFFVYSWSELPVLFLSMDANFVLKSVTGERIVDAKSFYKTHPTSHIADNELLAEVRIPEKEEGEEFWYYKFALTDNDYAIISIAENHVIKNGMFKNFRIAVSGIYNLPKRLSKLEEYIVGKNFSEISGEEIRKILSDIPDPVFHVKFDKEYRKEVLQNLICDRIEKIMEG